MFEKQSPENTRSVLSSDLIRDDHRLYHQMGNARQRVLLEVEEDGTYGGNKGPNQLLIQHCFKRFHIKCLDNVNKEKMSPTT